MAPALDEDRLAGWDAALARDDADYAAAYPGPPAPAQVHTVYVPVPRFDVDTVPAWGARALAAVEACPRPWRQVLAELPGDPDLLDRLTRRKLAQQPVEDLRIDLEDGFRGHRGTPADDADEDAQAVRAGVAAARFLATGELRPLSWGLRIRSLAGPTRRRGLRTLDLFLSAVLEHGPLPAGFVVTLPKVTSVAQVQVFGEVLDRLEGIHGLPAGAVPFEIQVETPQTILGGDGRAPLPAMIRAGGGRVSGLHFGTYDYSASLGILGAYQNLRHPVADFAKLVMLAAAAETGVRVSDGSDNRVPVGDPAVVGERWSAHAEGVTRALRQGIFQGWDLHPAQLPTRFAATFAFFRAGWSEAADRLSAYAAGRPGPAGVLDEPATAFALARQLAAGLACGALAEAELAGSGLDAATVARFLVRGTPPGP